jgi:hypothetical protein
MSRAVFRSAAAAVALFLSGYQSTEPTRTKAKAIIQVTPPLFTGARPALLISYENEI